MTLQIRLFHTSAVYADEVKVAAESVDAVAKYLDAPVHVQNYGETSDVDDWLSKCQQVGFGDGQVDVECVLKNQIPYSKARQAVAAGAARVEQWLAIVLTERDLTAPESTFLFGGGLKGLGALLSVNRLRRGIVKDTERELVLRRLVAHEFGHVLGLIPDDRTADVEEKIGLHCTNPCVMRQGMSLPDFRGLALEEERARVLFCQLCAQYLRGDILSDLLD